jgi:hypothetical protein
MRKYVALMLSLAGMAALVWAGMLTVRSAMAPMAPSMLASATAAPPIADGNLELAQLRRADQLLAHLEAIGPAPLALAGGPLAQAAAAPALSPPPSGSRRASGPVAAAVAKEPPTISMIYLSSDMQRAVINGRLYASGDVLPDGSKVIRISMKEVLIGREGTLISLSISGDKFIHVGESKE